MPSESSERIVTRASESRLVLAPEFHMFQLHHCRKELHWPRHIHRSYEVIYCLEGEYRARLNETPLFLQPGHGLVVKPGDAHEDFCEPPLRYFGMLFTLHDARLRDQPRSLFADDAEARHQCFSFSRHPDLTLRHMAADAERSTAEIQDAVLTRFIAGVIRALPADGLAPGVRRSVVEQDFAQRFLQVVRDHLAAPQSLAAMAREMGMSSSSLSHKCKEIFGQSAMAIATGERLRHAGLLLHSTSLSIKEIVPQVGFADAYAFSRAFRRVMGRSPSQYRNETP